MNKKHRSINRSVKRYISLLLATLMLSVSLVSCKGRPLAQGKLAKTEVGTVGGYTVLYEELYFLAHNYAKGLKDSYTDDAALDAAIWDAVNENITENYAILELCKQEGIIYDEKALRDDVSSAIEIDIEAEYDGSRSDYFESQLSVGLTDHYVRFITGINIIYGQLATEYKKNGTIPSSADVLVPYIQENFAHTWHIAVFINDESEREEKLAKIEEARKQLESGTSMYKLIGSQYNEDVTSDYLSDAYGYYFPRGIMDEKYEDTAFNLKVGDHAIVESKAENGNGETVPCLYLIERLSTTDEASKLEIEKNLQTLSSSLSDAIINDKKEAVRNELSFIPNDYAKSLDISELEPVRNGADYQMIIFTSLSIVFCALVITAIILINRARTKQFQKSIKKASKR